MRIFRKPNDLGSVKLATAEAAAGTNCLMQTQPAYNSILEEYERKKDVMSLPSLPGSPPGSRGAVLPVAEAMAPTRRGEAVRLGAHITNISRPHSSSEAGPLLSGVVLSYRGSDDGISSRPCTDSGIRRSSPVRERSMQWSARDVKIEEDIFSKGLCADTAFLCASAYPSSRPEAVFGQGALFSLLSPVLRERLFPSRLSADGADTSRTPVKRDKQGRQEVWLADEISANGFREVARYVYRLQPKFTLSIAADVVGAARFLQLPELDQGVISWGLTQLETLAPSRGQKIYRSVLDGTPVDESKNGQTRIDEGRADDVLRCLGVLCLPIGMVNPLMNEARHAAAVAWRDAMLQAFDALEIVSSPTFFELPEDALLLLLRGEEIHSNPALLWEKCVRWAQIRRQQERPPQKEREWCSGPNVVRPSRKLFVPGARLVTVSVPEPLPHEVDWQRWLLGIAELTRFQDMTAGAFAGHMDGINPMLPELRQVIYKQRRMGLQKTTTLVGNKPRT